MTEKSRLQSILDQLLELTFEEARELQDQVQVVLVMKEATVAQVADVTLMLTRHCVYEYLKGQGIPVMPKRQIGSMGLITKEAEGIKAIDGYISDQINPDSRALRVKSVRWMMRAFITYMKTRKYTVTHAFFIRNAPHFPMMMSVMFPGYTDTPGLLRSTIERAREIR